MKYTYGTKVRDKAVGALGVVISHEEMERFKHADKVVFPTDVCIAWGESYRATYDKTWVDENCEVLK